MTDVSKITAGVSNVIIEDLIPTVDSNVEGVDAKIAALLDLVEKYEVLANGKFRANFIEGSLNISRSNYHGGQLFKKYGPDAFDMREYTALTTIISKNGKFKVVEGLEAVRVEKKFAQLKKRQEQETRDAKSKRLDGKKEEKEIQSIKDGLKENDLSQKEPKVVINSSTEAESTSISNSLTEKLGMKYRKTNSTSIQDKKLPDKFEFAEELSNSTKQADPIDQFGALVPPLLYAAQRNFEEWIKTSVELVNIQKSIVNLVSDIELDLKQDDSSSI